MTARDRTRLARRVTKGGRRVEPTRVVVESVEGDTCTVTWRGATIAGVAYTFVPAAGESAQAWLVGRQLLVTGPGVVLESPDGSRWRVIVKNDGTLSTQSP